MVLPGAGGAPTPKAGVAAEVPNTAMSTSRRQLRGRRKESGATAARGGADKRWRSAELSNDQSHGAARKAVPIIRRTAVVPNGRKSLAAAASAPTSVSHDTLVQHAANTCGDAAPGHRR
eukprot:CAMPEP_0117546282 /NCGR_PEP_ID=MMETSP0784-20121206/46527_1 /TAXON_ID=39447 /ORGANISM="" /LENGTH=118 /DNA_ID=CAMNT_0005343149 /DNA_START=423 /DNA_END=777 /DNA_ORIENTATION=-